MRSFIVAAVLALVSQGCAESSAPNLANSGGLELSVVTTGPYPDPDGYRVLMDGVPRWELSSRDRLFVPGIPVGSHTLTLTGVAEDCLVSGGPSRTVTLSDSGSVRLVNFTVSCNGGKLEIETVTTGVDLDADGYEISIDDGPGLPVESSRVIPELQSGPHIVRLSGLAGNCTLAGSDDRTTSQQVTITPAAAAHLRFDISCSSTSGAVRLRVSTTGPDPARDGLADLNGYWVHLDGRGSVAVATNAEVVVDGVSVGSSTVSIHDVSPNCAVTSDTSQAVHLVASSVARDTASVLFTVSCRAVDTLIAFVHAPGTGPELHIADASGVDLDWFVDGGDHPSWSPDGRHVLYVWRDCYSPDCSYGIYQRTLGDGTSIPLTTDEGDDDPAWRPDGDKIAFARYWSLHLMDPDGRNVVRLATPSWAWQPTWSPDGTRLAFTCEIDDNNEDICVINADGSGYARLTTEATRESQPAWSPDGSRILFSTNRFSGMSELGLMLPDGTGIQRLLPSVPAVEPTWLASGQQITFSGFVCDLYTGCRTRGVFLVNADGTGLRQLTTGPHHLPAWRPVP